MINKNNLFSHPNKIIKLINKIHLIVKNNLMINNKIKDLMKMKIKVLFIMINYYLIHLKEFIKMIDKIQLIVINYLMSNHKIKKLMKFNHKMINFLNRMINRVNIKKNQIK
jgi:hypothetical protein